MLATIAERVAQGRANEVRRLIRKALAEGFNPPDILERGLVVGMTRISNRYRDSEIYVPDVLLASRAMQGGLRLVKPLLSDPTRRPKARVVIGTVAGDIHDIGKGLIALVMEASGYEVIDLGIDVPATRFVAAVRRYSPAVLAMSALLTVTMGVMAEVIDLLERAHIRDRCKVIVGGAPVSLDFAENSGADGYGVDAAEALVTLEALVGE
jgi:5-methyltetrahydrofolate--homocysteine methyltransferase